MLEQYQGAIVNFTTDGLIWSTTWEDHAVIEAALELQPRDSLLMIAGAGCNVLNALLHRPSRIVAVDINPAQIALVELKLAAIRELDHPGFLGLMGVENADDRAHTYERLRPRLSATSQDFWDAHVDDLGHGLLHAGRTEKMFASFIPAWQRVHSSEVMDRLFAFQDLAAQAAYFEEVIATPAFRQAFHEHHSMERRIAEHLVIPIMAIFFAGREQAFDDMWWSLLHRTCTTVPLHDNFYTRFFLTGAYSVDSRPPYLHRDAYPVLQSGVERVTCLVGSLEAAIADASKPFSKAHLSNIIVNLDDETKASIAASVLAKLRSGGRFCYWGSPLLASREHLRSHGELTARLASRDRVPWYGDLHIEEPVA